MRLSILILLVFLFSTCNGTSNNTNTNKPANAGNSNSNNTVKSNNVTVYTYEIVNTYKHDPTAFTQGLVFLDGFFYEGTGGRKDDSFHSSLRKVEIARKSSRLWKCDS